MRDHREVDARVVTVTRTQTARGQIAAVVRLQYRDPVTNRFASTTLRMNNNFGLLYEIGIDVHEMAHDETVKGSGSVVLDTGRKRITDYVRTSPPAGVNSGYQQAIDSLRAQFLRVQKMHRRSAMEVIADVLGRQQVAASN